MTRTPRPLYRELASLFQAFTNCLDNPTKGFDPIWRIRHRESIETLCNEFMPSGSGIDCGTKFDFDASKPDKLVLLLSYHHMNDGGCYDGWTEHTLTIRPSLSFEFNTIISGRNRNMIKEYLYEVYDCALRQEVYQDEEGDWHSSAHDAIPQNS